MKKLYFILLLSLIGYVAKSQTVNHIEPANMSVSRLKIVNAPEGASTDSVIVKAGDWLRRVVAPGQFIVNTTAVGLSKAQLNTAYPNVPIGYRVICPSITLGGAIYTKATEAGTNDVWLMTSSTPVL